MKCDYVVVTKNDAKTIHKTIESIRRQNNVNRVIVIVSKRSNDDTLGIVRKMRNEGLVDIVRTEIHGLAFARRLGINYVRTEWFVFVDGDVILNDHWSVYMNGHLDDVNRDNNVGAIAGLLYRNKQHLMQLEKSSESTVVDTRMFTHNTMIRTELVKDWNPSISVNAWEDYLITQHIKSKGYLCYNVLVLSKHDHQGSIFKAAVWNGAGMKRVGAPFSLFRFIYDRIFGGFKNAWQYKNKWFFTYAVLQTLGILYGRSRWKKYFGATVR